MSFTVIIEADAIRFQAYPFVPASVYPDGVVPAAAIRGISSRRAPSEVWLESGETLFVPAPGGDGLRAFGASHGLRDRIGIDVWGLLLEPFIDSEIGTEEAARSLRALLEVGLDESTIEAIRVEVSASMVAYNFVSGLWEWCHLGLFDLLSAGSGSLVSKDLVWPPEVMAERYWRFMAIAARGWAEHEELEESGAASCS